MSINVKVDFDKVNLYLESFSQIGLKKHELLDAVGALVVSQTQERIFTEKTSPDGMAWDPWKASTAKKRNSNHSLLMHEQKLLESIDSEVGNDEVFVGSNMFYAGFINDGTENMQARPFIGLSSDNKIEIEETLTDFLQEAFQ